MGPFVAHSRRGADLFDYRGERGGTACALLIETRAAIGNIEEVRKVEGIDCLTIASFDPPSWAYPGIWTLPGWLKPSPMPSE
jgi:2-keto-3-deoxy-L-rhamnonate aldolase RhmA